MTLSMVGVSHRSAGLDELERVAIRAGERGPLLRALRDAGCQEAVVLSTCSRTELYGVGDEIAGPLIAVLAAHCRVERDELRARVESREGLAVAEHLFRVSAGLTSRVIGEMEIHGQVRAALREAREHGTAGPVLERLFGTALLCGRRVRDETSLGAQGRSLASKAVQVGMATVTGGVEPAVLVVGAGRMARVAVECLVRSGVRPRVVARDADSAARLVGTGGARGIDGLADSIREADVVICATSAAHDVITLEQVHAATAARADRPLTLVDLSVPRNVDTAVAALPGVHLIDLEGMDDAVSDPEVQAALEAGAAIVASLVRRYAEDVATTAAGPVISAMYDRTRQTCLDELRSSTGRTGLSDADVARLAHAVAGKLLHRPVLAARSAAAAGDTAALAMLSRLFGGDVVTVGSTPP